MAMRFALDFALATLVSGAMFCLALPPADFWFFGWIAFVPLLVVVRNRGFIVGFAGGLLALFTTAYLAKSGIFYSQKAFSGVDSWVWTGCGLFGFVVSLLIGTWADKTTSRPIWWYAAIAIVLEAGLLIVLPAHLALSQYRQPLMLWIASIGGIWMSSFVLWMSNVAIAHSIRERRWKLLGFPAVALLITAGFSLMKRTDEESGIEFGLVQTDKTDAKALGQLHQKASKTNRTIVVWPEFAGLGIVVSGDTKPLQKVSAEYGGAPIVTSYTDTFQPKPHNVASLVTPDTTSEPYHKRKLFGGEKNMHTAGDRAVSVETPQGVIALGICFDSCYPAIVRQAANRQGVVAMALPTIDPDSPHHFIASIHAAFTPFRAAENGIVIARADGFAYSMLVDAKGNIVKELPPGEMAATGNGSIGGPTIYRRFGDWFLYACIFGAVYGAWAYRKPKGKAATSEEERLKEFAEKAIREVKGN